MTQEINFFSDQPVPEDAIVQLATEPSAWLTVGGPIALTLFFFFVCFMLRYFIPYKDPKVVFSLQDLPVAAQRGIGLATILFGIAFFFGLTEVHLQLQIHGGTDEYFANMTTAKLVAFTHAHLFGFTTAIFIVGIPFSMHFNSVGVYQWVFPAALAAAFTDIISWWGIKFVSPNFDYITMACGAVYGGAYLWMLIGLVRVIFFPTVKWLPDYINEQRKRRAL